ncbi:MAG: hypothetical protein AAGI07_09690 [Bacteroidota bacterium]
MSKKLNVSGLFSSEPLPNEETQEVQKPVEKVIKSNTKAKENKKAPQDKTNKKLGRDKEEIPNEEEAKSVNLQLNLGKIKKRKPIEYISFKLKRDVHNQLSKIAKKENIDYTGNLIHLVLEDFIKQYTKED